MNQSRKNILVTGGAGNIGTNLCNELRLRGHHVIAADLYNTERDDYIRADVRNYRQLQSIFEELGPFDFVYHLAAEYGRWNGEAYYENLWQTNNVGTKHILRLQEKLGFKLIFFSSCEVYGDYSGFMTEDVMIELDKFRGQKPALLFNSEIMIDKPFCFTKPWNKVLKEAEIEEFRFHDLRHTCASYLAQSGASLLEIADVLGHRQISMTARYSHLCVDHKQKLINNVFPSLLSSG